MITPMITAENLNGLDRVRHGFFTRAGGVSAGLYASMNVGYGSDDEDANVAANRARAMAQLDLDPKALVTIYQVHGTDVAEAKTPWPAREAPKADAVVSRVPGIALGIQTADCAPILLCDGTNRVIGAVHAGWRGALDGVIGAAVRAMAGLGAVPAATHAAIGPCIGQASYQVGPEFPAPFLAQDGDNARFFVDDGDGRWRFDLAGYVAADLQAQGVGHVEHTGHDTCRDREQFFSYRRSFLEGEPDYGRGLSAIALAGGAVTG